jgi:hypothetical protein
MAADVHPVALVPDRPRDAANLVARLQNHRNNIGAPQQLQPRRQPAGPAPMIFLAISPRIGRNRLRVARKCHPVSRHCIGCASAVLCPRRWPKWPRSSRILALSPQANRSAAPGPHRINPRTTATTPALAPGKPRLSIDTCAAKGAKSLPRCRRYAMSIPVNQQSLRFFFASRLFSALFSIGLAHVATPAHCSVAGPRYYRHSHVGAGADAPVRPVDRDPEASA